MIRMTTAITSRRWIKPPPMWPMKPRSQRMTKMTIIVQSMGIPFCLVKLSPGHLSRGSSTCQAFSEVNHACKVTGQRDHTRPANIKLLAGNFRDRALQKSGGRVRWQYGAPLASAAAIHFEDHVSGDNQTLYEVSA